MRDRMGRKVSYSLRKPCYILRHVTAIGGDIKCTKPRNCADSVHEHLPQWQTQYRINGKHVCTVYPSPKLTWTRVQLYL